MDTLTFIAMIEEHIVTPAIIAFGGILIGLIKHYAEKISKSVITKNELSKMEKQANTRNQLIQTISESVKAAVASNMETAKSMKEGGRKLTDEQIFELNNSAINIVIGSLPPSLTEEGGVLLEVIGSREKLNNLVSALMEKYVYEYKANTINIETVEVSAATSEIAEQEYETSVEPDVQEYHEEEHEEISVEESPVAEPEPVSEKKTERTHTVPKKTPILY